MIHFDDSATQRFLEQWDNSQPFIEAHTSGSTGTPKIIRLSKNDMVASATATCEYFGINASSVMVCPLSADYIAGKMMIVRAIVSGATLYMELPSNNPLLTDYPELNLVPIVPSQLPGLVNATRKQQVKNVIIGGAPLSATAEAAIERVSFKAFATYGMTETCSHVALRIIGNHNNVYEALPGYTLGIDNRSCLIINSSTQSFGQIVTNDVVTLVDERHFVWKGRYDNVIISGGLKVHPEIVEKTISKHINRELYISAGVDAKWGQRVILNIEGPEFDTEELLSALRMELKTHELPREIIFHDCFSRTKSGKIIRT